LQRNQKKLAFKGPVHCFQCVL